MVNSIAAAHLPRLLNRVFMPDHAQHDAVKLYELRDLHVFLYFLAYP